MPSLDAGGSPKPNRNRRNSTPPIRFSVRDLAVKAVAPSRISEPRRISSSAGSSRSITSWRPSYYKPNDRNMNNLVSSLQTMRNRMSDYEYSSRLGQVIENRYSIYQDQMDRRYDKQRRSYETALKLASTLAKEGEDVEVPDKPKVPGIKPGLGINAMNQSWNRALASARTEKEAEGINRYFRYELERLQSIQNNIRDQRKSLASTKDYFDQDMTLAIARGDVEESQLQRALAPKDKKLAKRREEAAAQDAKYDAEHGYNQDDSDGGSFLGINVPGSNPVSRAVDAGLKKVWGESKDPLFWTIDKLSRPSFGVNNTLKGLYELDEDDRGKNWYEKGIPGKLALAGEYTVGGVVPGFLHATTGSSPLDFMDEIAGLAARPGGLANQMVPSFWEGFSGKDKTTFGDVIAANAREDGVEDFRDAKRYQTFMGIFGDIGLDPLNAVGVGVVTKPIAAAKGAKDVRNLKGIAEDYSKLLKDQQPVGPVTEDVARFSDPKEVYQFMVGSHPKGTKSIPQKRSHVFEVANNVDQLIDLLGSPKGAQTGRLSRLEGLRTALAARRQALVDEFGDDVLTQEARESLEKQIQAGNASIEDLEDFNLMVESLSSKELEGLIIPASQHISRLEKGAKALGAWPSRSVEEVGSKTGRIVRSGEVYEEGLEGTTSNSGNIFVPEATTEKLSKQRRSAYENLLDMRERKRESMELGNLSKKEFEEFSAAVDKVKEDNPFKSLEDAIPSRLKNDPRLSDVDWTALLRKSYALLNKMPNMREYESVSRAMQGKPGESVPGTINHLKALVSKGERDGWDPKRVQGYRDDLDRMLKRKEDIDRPRLEAQSSILIKLLKDHIAKGQGKTTFSNPEAASLLIDELNEVQRLLSGYSRDDLGNIVSSPHTPRSPSVARDLYDKDEVSFLGRGKLPTTPASGKRPVENLKPKGGSDSAPDLSGHAGGSFKGGDSAPPFSGTSKKYAEDSDIYTMGEVALRRREKEIRRELRSLEGGSASHKVIKHSDIPEQFLNDSGVVDFAKLNDAIGWSRSNHTFNVKGNYSKDSWANGLRDFLQREYEVAYNELAGKSTVLRNGTRQQKNAEINKISDQAKTLAVDATKTGLNEERLFEHSYSDTLELMLPKESVEQRMIEVSNAKYAAKIASLQAQRRLSSGEEIADLNSQIKSVRRQQERERIRINKDAKVAREAQRTLVKRMKEEALFRVAELEMAEARKFASFNVMGQQLVLPGAPAMIRTAIEKANGFNLIKGTRENFARAFKSPASTLTPEGQLIRSRAIAHTPNIIEHHINRLRMTLGRIPENDRRTTFKAMVDQGYAPKRGVDENFDMINETFRDLVPYFNNSTPVGNSILTVSDINRYLPEEFRLDFKYVRRNGIHSPQDIVKAVRSGKQISRGDRRIYQDPYRMSWTLRVGLEKAQAMKAMEYSIGESFGIPRISGMGLKNPSKRAQQFDEVLGKFENLGWKSIPELGNRYLFPPESVGDIQSLLRMMEPNNLTEIGAMVDKVTGAWKAVTTIYNPGYWTRNGVGEVMSSWLGGVNTIQPYHWARDVMTYARGDQEVVNSIIDQFPLEHFKNNAKSPGKKVLFKSKGGKDVTAEQLWVMYQDQGLKTGFVNTEFSDRFSKLGSGLRENAGVKGLVGVNDKLRSAGEWYEDYLRLAHFADSVKKHGGSLEEAAASAAADVRKYHFDYTDFTNFEKITMLRAFPFYKWTRKAAPMMMTMLFTKPGKMMVYPKVMNGLTTQDIALDDNGYAPTYSDMVPGWVQDLWAYKIAEGDDEEDSTYGRVATPQMDALQSIVAPGSAGYSLLNPLFKVPIEQAQGFVTSDEKKYNLKNLFGAADMTNNDNMNIPLNTNEPGEGKNRIAHLLRSTPQGSYASKFMSLYDGDDGKPSRNNNITFWTGMGAYDVDDAPKKKNKKDK